MNISSQTKVVLEKLDTEKNGINFSDIKKLDTNNDGKLSESEALENKISINDVKTINANILNNYSKHAPSELVFPSVKRNENPAKFNNKELALLNKQFGVHGEKSNISQLLMPLGETTRGLTALATIYDHNKEIKAAAKQYNVDPAFMAAIIYEEQAHLLPGEEWNDAKGNGTSIGLSQVGVGELIKQGFFPGIPKDAPVIRLTPQQVVAGRDHLLNPKNNIIVLAKQVQRLQAELGYPPGTLKADSYFGAHALAKIAYVHNGFSDYPRRVMNYMKSPEVKNVLNGNPPVPVPNITTPPMGS